MTDFYSRGKVITRIPNCAYTQALLHLDPTVDKPSLQELFADEDLVVSFPRGSMETWSVDSITPRAGSQIAALVVGVLRRLHRFGVHLPSPTAEGVADLFEGFKLEVYGTSNALGISWDDHMPAATLPLCQVLAEWLDTETRRREPWVLRGEVAYTASHPVGAPDVEFGGMVFLVSAIGHEVYDTVDVLSQRNTGVLPAHVQEEIVRLVTERWGESLELFADAVACEVKNWLQSVTSKASRGSLPGNIFPDSLRAQLRFTREEYGKKIAAALGGG